MAARIQICGNVVATVDGRRIEAGLPGRQGRQLFVYLVLHRLRAVPRDELTSALWPYDVPASSESALSALLSKLRRVVPLDGRGELRLKCDGEVFVDLEAAQEALHRAESAVRQQDHAAAWGPARVALHTATRGFLRGDDAPWIADVRGRLDDMLLRAHECVAHAGIGLGGPELDAALRSSRALVRLAPLRESGYRLLMQALHLDGNDAEAIAVYDGLRVRLRDELGTAPSPPTQQLHVALLG